MKNNLLTLIVLLLSTQLQATIYRLGYLGTPISGIDFAYTDFGNAQNAASPGDTIQVYQQLNNIQSNFSVEKRLAIIGFGHTLNVNSGLQVQSKNDSSINSVNITFQAGSAFSSIEGLNIGVATIRDSNITIRRCRFKNGTSDAGFIPCFGGTSNLWIPQGGYCVIGDWYGGTGPYNNITIQGCYFDRREENTIHTNQLNPIHNLNITNNYFNGPVDLFNGINGQITGVFANNIVNLTFNHLANVAIWNSNICTQGSIGYYGYPMQSEFDYFLIKNNIFNTGDTVLCPLIAPNCIIQNNVFSTGSSFACAGLGGTNNIYGADMNQVFESAWNGGLVYNDNQLGLAPASVAINAGVKSDNTPTNCGIYGGEAGQAYKKSGIPPIPAVYQLSAPSINATSNPYNITISVRSNN